MFHKDYAITIRKKALDSLKNVIPNIPSGISIASNPPPIFYNVNGPEQTAKSEIYIECQPTGGDGEILAAPPPTSGGLLDNAVIQQLLSADLVKVFVGAIMMLVIWKISMKIIDGIASNSARIASFAVNNVTKIPV